MIMLQSKDENKGTLHQKLVRQRRKSLTDTCTTLRSRSECLQTTALPSSPLCHLHRYISSPAPSTYALHLVTMDIYLHISGYSSARGILCSCVFVAPAPFRLSHTHNLSIASWSDQYHQQSGDETTESAPMQLKCDGYIYIYIYARVYVCTYIYIYMHTYKRKLTTLHD